MEAFAEALAVNATLEFLHLEENKIGSAGGQALRSGPADDGRGAGDGWRERCWGNISFWKKTKRCGSATHFSKKCKFVLFHSCFCLIV